MLAALRTRDLRVLMAAFAISRTGAWVYNVGLIAYVYDHTHSAAWVGGASAGRLLPAIAVGMYGGVVADRFERVRLLAGLDLACFAMMGALGVLAINSAPVAAAIVIAAAVKLCSTVYEPAITALLPAVVPEQQLIAANTLRVTVERVAIAAGSAAGGALLLVGPAWVGFFVNAGSFAASAVLVSLVRVRDRPRPASMAEGADTAEPHDASEKSDETEPPGRLREALVGMRAVGSSALAVALVVYGAAAALILGIDTIQLVVVSQHRLGTGADGYGYLLAGLGLGGVLAAAVVDRIAAIAHIGLVLLVSMLVYCLPTLALLVVHQPGVAFVIEVLRGTGGLVVGVITITALQRCLRAELLARVFSVYLTLMLVAAVVAALALPPLLASFGLNATLWAAGLGVPVLCVLGLPWLRRIDRAAVARMRLLAPRIELLRGAGILADAPRVVLESLASQAGDFRIKPGQVIIRQGEEADAFYVIVSGEVAVSGHAPGGPEVDFPSLGPGDFFGEIGLIHHRPRTATVIASTECRLLAIDGETFLSAVQGSLLSAAVLDGSQARLARGYQRPDSAISGVR